jgi:hypothetical protein
MSESTSTGPPAVLDPAIVELLKERYECPNFRILVVGRANAGKTTILEKVCGVQQGTKPIIRKAPAPQKTSLVHRIFNRQKQASASVSSSSTECLKPSIYRGEHDIEDEITYEGSNFVFHDSRGIEAGAVEEMVTVRDFINKRSTLAVRLRDRLHAIWYCIPLDVDRHLAEAELAFFKEGTGTVPLVAVFTKFDGLVVNEYCELQDVQNEQAKWKKARANAEKTFQEHYLHQIMTVKNPPRGFVILEEMDRAEKQCPELSEKTAAAIDVGSLRQLFTSTQMNNFNLCIKEALKDIVQKLESGGIFWTHVLVIALLSFPHVQSNKKCETYVSVWGTYCGMVLDKRH